MVSTPGPLGRLVNTVAAQQGLIHWEPRVGDRSTLVAQRPTTGQVIMKSTIAYKTIVLGASLIQRERVKRALLEQRDSADSMSPSSESEFASGTKGTDLTEHSDSRVSVRYDFDCDGKSQVSFSDLAP